MITWHNVDSLLDVNSLKFILKVKNQLSYKQVTLNSNNQGGKYVQQEENKLKIWDDLSKSFATRMIAMTSKTKLPSKAFIICEIEIWKC